jgi:hypothetical protein
MVLVEVLEANDKVRPSSVERCWPAGNVMSVETEEPPLLKAVTRKLLVKTLQAGEELVFT